MNEDTVQSEIRELDRRTGDGFDVALLWSAHSGRVFVAVEDARTGDGFRIAVDPPDALDAFRHPYADDGSTDFRTLGSRLPRLAGRRAVGTVRKMAPISEERR